MNVTYFIFNKVVILSFPYCTPAKLQYRNVHMTSSDFKPSYLWCRSTRIHDYGRNSSAFCPQINYKSIKDAPVLVSVGPHWMFLLVCSVMVPVRPPGVLCSPLASIFFVIRGTYVWFYLHLTNTSCVVSRSSLLEKPVKTSLCCVFVLGFAGFPAGVVLHLYLVVLAVLRSSHSHSNHSCLCSPTGCAADTHSHAWK